MLTQAVKVGGTTLRDYVGADGSPGQGADCGSPGSSVDLRGTPLDVFGWSAHRRRERALIGEYEQLVETLLAGLHRGNHALAVQLAALPERVRGFDVVKEAAMEQAATARATLLAEFAAVPLAAATGEVVHEPG